MVRSGTGFHLTLAAVMALALAATTNAAKADTPVTTPPALASLETMIQNLGYTTKDSSTKQSFSIVWPGKYNYTMHFSLSQDGTIGYTYVDLATFTPPQTAKIQFVNMLEADDVGDFYFSMEHNSDGETAYANAMIPLDGLTPSSLRDTLTGFSNKIDQSEDLWNTDLWK
jgi:hypothetical protein